MKVCPQLYIRGSVDAAAFYQAAFGLVIGMTDMNPDGTYKHVSLLSGDTEILAIGENPENTCYYDAAKRKDPISINLWELGSNEAVDRAFAVLSTGAHRIDAAPGTPEWADEGEFYAFSVIDKYGVNWWVCG